MTLLCLEILFIFLLYIQDILYIFLLYILFLYFGITTSTANFHRASVKQSHDCLLPYGERETISRSSEFTYCANWLATSQTSLEKPSSAVRTELAVLHNVQITKHGILHMVCGKQAHHGWNYAVQKSTDQPHSISQTSPKKMPDWGSHKLPLGFLSMSILLPKTL